MSQENSPRLGLDYLMPAQAQKHVTVNESFRRLDALVQMSAASRTVSDQPADPDDGTIWIMPAAASGAIWSTFGETEIAVFRDTSWVSIPPRAGWRCWIEDENVLVIFDGTDWVEVGETLSRLANLERLGVGTAADAANPFSAKLNAALWAARTAGEGGTGDLRYTLNKEAPANVLSLLFQSNWSGRAEFGLVGDDDLVAKVSPDGSAWIEAMRLDNATGDLALAGNVTVTSFNDGPLGGLRNLLINGGLEIAQRGTDFTGLTDGDFALDRWCIGISGGGASGVDAERLSLSPAELPSGLRHALRVQPSGGGGSGSCQLIQKGEWLHETSGRVLTLSAWVKADAAFSLTASLTQNFGTGGSAAVTVSAAAQSVTTGWTRLSWQFGLASIAGKTVGPGAHLAVAFDLPVSGTPVVDFAGLQLETGTRATAFETCTGRGGEGAELRQCQRYFRRYRPGAYNAFDGVAIRLGSNVARLVMPFDPPFRASPSLSWGGSLQLTPGDAAVDSLTVFTLNSGLAVLQTATTDTITADAMMLRALDSAAHISISAEL
ncbi:MULTISPECIES: DUF2793 domain-containing protein [Hyphobacterium]|uniref:DUF2793 domain-containing protein n=1 Tax=Hyphobacterium vulgare TaxID=1736751 RepID=A0ABV7A0J2_9PROT